MSVRLCVCVSLCLCVSVFVCLCLRTLPLLEAITERGQDMAHGHKAIRSDQTDNWSHTLPRHNMCCSYIDITHLEGAIFDTCSSILGGIHMQCTRPLTSSSFNQKGSFGGLFHITTRPLDLLSFKWSQMVEKHLFKSTLASSLVSILIQPNKLTNSQAAAD